MFGYTLAEEFFDSEELLESPRVKNAPVKPYFAFAYFLMTYLTLLDTLVSIRSSNASLHDDAEPQQLNFTKSVPQPERQLSASPGLNQLELQNIIINNSSTESTF